MPRTCTVCVHPEIEAINAALVANEPLRMIASRYGTVGRMALQRHKDEHLPALLVKSEQAREIAHADHLLAEANRLYAVATTVMDAAQQSKDYELVLKAVGTGGRVLSLLGELLGEINRSPHVNILIAPQWIEVRGQLMRALADYPEARASVAAVLMEVDGAHA